MENEKKANDAYKFVAEALPDRFTYVFKYALQKGYSRQRKNASLYRDRCIICYNNTVLITGLCAIYI